MQTLRVCLLTLFAAAATVQIGTTQIGTAGRRVQSAEACPSSPSVGDCRGTKLRESPAHRCRLQGGAQRGGGGGEVPGADPRDAEARLRDRADVRRPRPDAWDRAPDPTRLGARRGPPGGVGGPPRQHGPAAAPALPPAERGPRGRPQRERRLPPRRAVRPHERVRPLRAPGRRLEAALARRRGLRLRPDRPGAPRPKEAEGLRLLPRDERRQRLPRRLPPAAPRRAPGGRRDHGRRFLLPSSRGIEGTKRWEV